MSTDIIEDKSEIVREQNPFGGAELASPVKTDGALAAVATREVAEVQGMVFMAKQFPRNKIKSMERILNDCARPTLARGALYEYARGGTNITGPSIRLAESIAQNWGNIDFGIKELEQSNGVSKVMAFAWDLETNARNTKIFEVPHLRYTKKGTYPLQDPRDIYELVANNGARRLRACILGVIPGDVVEAAVRQCEKTLTCDPENSSPEKIKALVEAFEKEFNVPKLAIEKRIQRRIEAIQPAQVVQLRAVYRSLKDGMATPDSFFELETPEGEEKPKGVKGLSEALKK